MTYETVVLAGTIFSAATAFFFMALNYLLKENEGVLIPIFKPITFILSLICIVFGFQQMMVGWRYAALPAQLAFFDTITTIVLYLVYGFIVATIVDLALGLWKLWGKK